MSQSSESDLKLRTARTMKWSVIDRVSSQVLYAVTGIVLAWMLSPDDFGLVGAILVFQAFASLMVDSGFSYALIQRKNPTQTDYSTVFWFNLLMACGIYLVLFFLAPCIASWFQGDTRLIALSRVMFVTFILNALAIVQTNRLTKQMNMRPVAIANSVGLAAGAVVGIWLAVAGFGAWAIVWQSITLSAVKALMLWVLQRWLPTLTFSWRALRSFLSVGMSMMFTSFLNTVFLNIYSFIIGNRVGLAPLGYYTQSDKWSKMGISSLSQVLTSSFLPVLSGVQDDPERFRRVASKMNRTTAYILFPATIGLIVMAPAIFHALFSTKWDASIVLFQLLVFRGIFTVLTGLYNNYIIALGRSKAIVWFEILRDSVAVVALIITWPYMGLSTATDPVWGLRILLWGQVIASFVAWVVTLRATATITGASIMSYLADCAPYLITSLVIAPVMIWGGNLCAPLSAWLSLAAQGITLCGVYLLVNHLLHSKVQRDAIAYFKGRL